MTYDYNINEARQTKLTKISSIIVYSFLLLLVLWFYSFSVSQEKRRGETVMEAVKVVNLEDVLTRVGVFGRWQQKIVAMLMIASFIGGNNLFVV